MIRCAPRFIRCAPRFAILALATSAVLSIRAAHQLGGWRTWGSRADCPIFPWTGRPQASGSPAGRRHRFTHGTWIASEATWVTRSGT